MLAELVQASTGVSRAAGRNEKLARLRDWLRRLSPEEMAISVHYLSGHLPQGCIGVGPALLQMATTPPAYRRSGCDAR